MVLTLPHVLMMVLLNCGTAVGWKVNLSQTDQDTRTTNKVVRLKRLHSVTLHSVWHHRRTVAPFMCSGKLTYNLCNG